MSFEPGLLMRFGLHIILSLMILLAGPVAAKAGVASTPDCAGHAAGTAHDLLDMAKKAPHSQPSKDTAFSSCCMTGSLATLPEGPTATSGLSTQVSYRPLVIRFDPHAPRLISPPPKSSL
ncbi:MAG: hypothetical protein GC184_01005 [Rhizobiales bacterium]|nr:hypothetical protein [Hyphomicrobiales bacterium]